LSSRDFAQRIALGDERHDRGNLFRSCGHLDGLSDVSVVRKVDSTGRGTWMDI
jgi:hypothetical protein